MTEQPLNLELHSNAPEALSEIDAREEMDRAAHTHGIIEQFAKTTGVDEGEVVAGFVADSIGNEDEVTTGLLAGLLHEAQHPDGTSVVVEAFRLATPAEINHTKQILDLSGEGDDLLDRLNAIGHEAIDWSSLVTEGQDHQEAGHKLGVLTDRLREDAPFEFSGVTYDRKSYQDGSEEDLLDVWQDVLSKERHSDESKLEWLIQTWGNMTREIRLPEHESDLYKQAMEVLASGDYSDETAWQLIETQTKLLEYFMMDISPRYLDNVLTMPASKLSAVYMMEGDEQRGNPLHDLLDRQIIDGDNDRDWENYVELIDKCANYRLLEIAQTDKRMAEVVEAYESPAIAIIDTIPTSKEDYRGSDVEYGKELSHKTKEVLRELGLPLAMQREYFYATGVRNRLEDGSIFGVAVAAELVKMSQRVEHVGVDRVKQLHQTFGMENIWNYTDKELETLIKLADKDLATIEHMKAGDVTLQLFDVRGDYNGATLQDELRVDYEKESGRTLRLEMTSAESIYRHFIFLDKLGIKPSTLVYMAHGNPGGTGIGSGERRTNFTVDSPYIQISRKNRINIDETQIGRLVKDCMQPNRGIDSHSSQIGEKTIVLQTCSGDFDVEVPTFGNGIKFDSVAEAVYRNINKAGKDEFSVIAGSNVIYHQTQPDGSISFRKPGLVDGDDDPSATVRLGRRKGLLGRKRKLERQNIESFHVKKQSNERRAS